MGSRDELNTQKWNLHGKQLLRLCIQFMRDVPAESYSLLQFDYPLGGSDSIFRNYLTGSPPPEEVFALEFDKAVTEHLDEKLIEKKLGIELFCEEMRCQNGTAKSKEEQFEEEMISELWKPDHKARGRMQIENDMINRVVTGTLSSKFSFDFSETIQKYSNQNGLPEKIMNHFLRTLTGESLQYFREKFDPEFDFEEDIKVDNWKDIKNETNDLIEKIGKNEVKEAKQAETPKIEEGKPNRQKERKYYFVPIGEFESDTRKSLSEASKAVANLITEIYEVLNSIGFYYSGMSNEEIKLKLRALGFKSIDVIRFKDDESVFQRSLEDFRPTTLLHKIGISKEKIVLKQIGPNSQPQTENLKIKTGTMQNPQLFFQDTEDGSEAPPGYTLRSFDENIEHEADDSAVGNSSGIYQISERESAYPKINTGVRDTTSIVENIPNNVANYSHPQTSFNQLKEMEFTNSQEARSCNKPYLGENHTLLSSFIETQSLGLNSLEISHKPVASRYIVPVQTPLQRRKPPGQLPVYEGRVDFVRDNGRRKRRVMSTPQNFGMNPYSNGNVIKRRRNLTAVNSFNIPPPPPPPPFCV